MKKVLVVDDDPDILEAIQMILATEAYDSQATTNGSEVYKMVESYEPDLIILDVLLSGDDGRTICKKLKSEIKSEHIPVIMISAHPDAKSFTKECSADSFIAKPFSVTELLSEVKKLIK